jgi:hypothetical protein
MVIVYSFMVYSRKVEKLEVDKLIVLKESHVWRLRDFVVFKVLVFTAGS